MSIIKTLILRAPGTASEAETAVAFEKAGASVSIVHIDELKQKAKLLKDYRILVLPGGLTYGDDLGSGKVIAGEISTALNDEIKTFIEDGGLILGISNGFAALVKSGLLPDPAMFGKQPKATLTYNASGKFECRWVNLKVNPESSCVFTKGIEKMYLPVACSEGRFMTDTGELASIDVPLYYADECGISTMQYPDNPTGSLNGIAGICDKSGRILGLIPNPERFISAKQHPRWTTENLADEGDGFKIFQNAVNWVKQL
ncbi:MAG: phosphoribosylformylglycinamidine synthase subunit PurQ [Dehalococcoidales bacterium]